MGMNRKKLKVAWVRKRIHVPGHFRYGWAKVVKSSKRQVGTTSRKHDRRYRALSPGKRKSRTGHTYYEYRRNRSDIGKLFP